jgi:cell division protein FtsA
MSKPNDKNGRLLAGLDLGTTKVCCVVAYMNDDLTLDFKGFGESESKGMVNGKVVNVPQTKASIRQALAEAEAMSGFTVASVYVGLAGDFVRSVNSDGLVSVKNGVVSQEDIDRAVRTAKTIALPGDFEILQTIPQEFRVDGEGRIKNPLRLTCQSRLEVDVHLILAAKTHRENIINCVVESGLSVNDIFLESIASAEAVLTDQERELGVCLLDMGGGTVDGVVFAGGSVRHTFEIPEGGRAMTEDLAHALNQGFDTAEMIKVEFGCCHSRSLGESLQLNVPKIGGEGTEAIYNETVCDILEPRATALFRAVESELAASGTLSLVRNLVLTGGTSQMQGMRELAHELFHVPVRIGSPSYQGGVSTHLNNPKYSTVVGLLIHGWQSDEASTGTAGAGQARGGLMGLLDRLLGRS